jgi:hypothetical protein
MGPLFERGSVPAFNEQACFGFRARVTQQDPATVSFDVGFRLRDEFEDTIHLIERFLFSNYYVRDKLRETGPASRQFRKRYFFHLHNAEYLQCRD